MRVELLGLGLRPHPHEANVPAREVIIGGGVPGKRRDDWSRVRACGGGGGVGSGNRSEGGSGSGDHMRSWNRPLCSMLGYRRGCRWDRWGGWHTQFRGESRDEGARTRWVRRLPRRRLRGGNAGIGVRGDPTGDHRLRAQGQRRGRRNVRLRGRELYWRRLKASIRRRRRDLLAVAVVCSASANREHLKPPALLRRHEHFLFLRPVDTPLLLLRHLPRARPPLSPARARFGWPALLSLPRLFPACSCSCS
jgi:hypothetical protein